jgi:hypothetical protein
MAFNHFAAAKPVEAPKKSKKSDKPRVEIPGMALLSDIDAAIANLEALRAVAEADVKDAMMAHFVQTGSETMVRPENFEGFDGTATGSCQLKIRSSASALTDEEVAKLTEFGIPCKTVIESRERFAFNPEHIKDQRILSALSKALGKIKIDGEPLPEDLIQVIPEKSKCVASEEGIEALFKTGNEKVIRAALPTVTVLAVAPKKNSDSVAAFATVMAHLNSANDDDQKAA